MLEFKSHTADVRLKASAETIPELFFSQGDVMQLK